jgi:hypothetical protein
MGSTQKGANLSRNIFLKKPVAQFGSTQKLETVNYSPPPKRFLQVGGFGWGVSFFANFKSWRIWGVSELCQILENLEDFFLGV